MCRYLIRFAAILLLAGTAYGQSYKLTPEPWLQFVDADGNPYASAKLCTYAAGTSTPRSIFSDSSGTPHSNPATLDSAGRITVYLDDSLSYKLELRTAAATNCSTGTVLKTQDNVSIATPGSFTVTSNVIAKGTGAAGGLSDSSITDTGATVTIDPSGAISILGATTVNGGLTVTGGTTAVNALTVTSCTGCVSGSGYYQFQEDAIVIDGAIVASLALTTNTMSIGLPFAANSTINTYLHVPYDANISSDMFLELSYIAKTAPGATNNKVKLLAQVIINGTAAAFTAGDTITLANNTIPAAHTATVNKITASTVAQGDFVNMLIRRDVSVANNANVEFQILTIGWKYTKQ